MDRWKEQVIAVTPGVQSNPFYQSFISIFSFNQFHQSFLSILPILPHIYQFYHRTHPPIYIDWWREKKRVNTAVYLFGVWINSVRRNPFNQSFAKHTHYYMKIFLSARKTFSINPIYTISGIDEACPLGNIKSVWGSELRNVDTFTRSKTVSPNAWIATVSALSKIEQN